MTWASFRKAIRDGEGEDWNAMTNADLVLGGWPLCLDFMQVV